MKKRLSLRVIATGTLLTALVCHMNVAVAEVFAGQLGIAKRATDVWKFTCDGDSYYLSLYVADDGPGQKPGLNAQVFKSGRAGSTTDPLAEDGDDSGHGSPVINVTGGPGEYYVLVNKSGRGEKDYTAFVSCLTREGFHASIVADPNNPIQDQ